MHDMDPCQATQVVASPTFDLHLQPPTNLNEAATSSIILSILQLYPNTVYHTHQITATTPMASFASELQGATPPVPPPKPGSHETSRIATPTSAGVPPPSEGRIPSNNVNPAPTSIPDPGDQWLPRILQDKSYVMTE